MALTDDELCRSREAMYRFAWAEVAQELGGRVPSVEVLTERPFYYREDFARDFLRYAWAHGWIADDEDSASGAGEGAG